MMHRGVCKTGGRHAYHKQKDGLGVCCVCGQFNSVDLCSPKLIRKWQGEAVVHHIEQKEKMLKEIRDNHPGAMG